MIHRLIDLPPNVIGFKADWIVTEKDCEEVVVPSVVEHIEKDNQFNCLLILNDLNNSFKLNALQSLRKIKKLNYDIKRIAIVAETRTTRRLLKIINMVVPCEFKGFSQTEIGEAIHWVSEHKN